MGIYPSGIVYGIKIYNVIDNHVNDLYVMQCEAVMGGENRKEAKKFYERLPEPTKSSAKFLIYTECSSQYEDDFMMWYPISLDVFLIKFTW